MSEKHEFGSPGWMRALFAAIHRRATSAPGQLAGLDYSSCEVFTDVPAHLAKDDTRRLAWHFHIHDGIIECAEGELETADWKVTGDYASLLPLAKLELGSDTEAAMAKAQNAVGELIAAGKLKQEGTRERRPPFLNGLHDEMVRITI